MIKNLKLKNLATYIEETNIELKKINYFYGGNGSGKTTISNLIKNPEQYTSSLVEWEDEKVETIVYNKSFIKETFNAMDSINGIFTLGKSSKEIKMKIIKYKEELNEKNKIDIGLKKRQEDLKKVEQDEYEQIKNTCWSTKTTYTNIFPEVLKKFGTKEKFFEKCKLELSNKKEIEDLKNIQEKYNKIYESKLEKKEYIPNIMPKEISFVEDNLIFEKVITGNENIEIGLLIQKLNNSTWVKNGIQYMENDEDVCPFCQKKISKELKETIKSFFDETYEKDCNTINMLQIKYVQSTEDIIDKLNSLLLEEDMIKDRLKILIENFKFIIERNIENIKLKLENPNLKIKMTSSKEEIEQINILINEVNKKIKEDNKMIENIIESKENVNSMVWRRIVSDQENNITNFIKKNEGIKKGVAAVQDKIQENSEQIMKIKEEIEKLESSITSIKHTIISINNILKNFGFDGFKLEEASKGMYKIVRNDGTEVNETLSEGEYNFITFLYYYYLIKGSNKPSGIIKDKIIVIDDPISSLDSNVLFIVSTLVKDLIEDCTENRNGIKQIIILTHNVYFYKEITYKGTGKHTSNEEKFWIIKKRDNISKVIGYDENKIQTTYELLWNQIKEEDINQKNAANILNTMRRILEYYFNILGGKDYSKYIYKFDEEEKIIFRALISCINDGSHFITEDISLCLSEECVSKYLIVFKKIFEVTNNIEHYNMMMKNENLDSE